MSAANMHGPGTHGMITGLFTDRDHAEKAYNACRVRGYRPDDVNLAMTEQTRTEWFPEEDSDRPESELSTMALEGAGTGAAVGGAVGGTLGAFAAIGTSLVIPGLGLIVAGPLAAGLAGAGAGGLTGGLVGALIGWGVPEEHVKTYEDGLKNGGVVMAVSPRSREDAEYLHREWATQGEHVVV